MNVLLSTATGFLSTWAVSVPFSAVVTSGWWCCRQQPERMKYRDQYNVCNIESVFICHASVFSVICLFPFHVFLYILNETQTHQKFAFVCLFLAEYNNLSIWHKILVRSTNLEMRLRKASVDSNEHFSSVSKLI